jgi:hypothetical protein
MNTCGTCKHIKREARTVPRWDDSAEDMVEAVFHVCGRLKHLNGDSLILSEPAGTLDGSGYYAALCVTDEFGCTLWEPVEPVEGRK